MIHEAIRTYRTYVSSKWHKENRNWTTIERFILDGHLAKWIDESPALREKRNRENFEIVSKQLREHLDRQYAEEDKKRAIAKAAKTVEVKPIPKRPVQTELSLDSIVERLPQQYRWVIPTLISRKATNQAKASAKEQAMKICPRIRGLIPEPVKQRINVKIQAAWVKSGLALDKVPNDAWPLMQLKFLLKEIRKDRRQPHSIGHSVDKVLTTNDFKANSR